ncbi:MAG: PP2C family protein-serine/threonine phosphatase [Canibacter sp.]
MTVRGENASRQRLRYRPDSELTIELSWYGLTDVGLRRDKNQDSFVVTPPLFAVADGMGGHAAGEVASAAVVRRLAELGGSELVTVDDLSSRLIDAVDDIELEAGESGIGAGTTVTGVVFGADPESPTWTVFNIGDSRVYQYFKGALSQITVDHSVVQHLIDTGAITPEEAEVHPHANVITRAVGFNEDPVPDAVSLALIPGQRILICSDGLTKELTDLGVQHFLSQAETAEEAAKTLIGQALGNAGRDNVTAVVVDVHAVGDTRDTSDISSLVEETAEIPEDELETDPTVEIETDEVFIGTERVENQLRGSEVSASEHVGRTHPEREVTSEGTGAAE